MSEVIKKILFLSANPRQTKQLRLDEELREIKEGLRRAKIREQFVIQSAEAVRYRDIRRAMLDINPQIVHFSGHGSGEEGLVFEDESGQVKLIDADSLAGLFKLFADTVECVVLDTCYSQVQSEAIAQHIPYVVGMGRAIGDRAAIEFAIAFYDALGAGRDYEFAYDLACNAIDLAGIPESDTPKLVKGKALKLTGQQRKILREGIIGAYPNPDDLQILLSEQMDVQLGAIARGDAYNARVFSLIQDFEADGRIERFIRVIAKDKPKSPYLESIKNEFPGVYGESLNPVHRLELRQTLRALIVSDLNDLIDALQVPKGIIPPPLVDAASRVDALWNWADSPTGCGLTNLHSTLLKLLKPIQEQQLREQYSVWAKQIRQSLYESNSASLTEFPAVHHDFILQKFSKDFDFLNLIFHQDTITFKVSEQERINSFREAWQKAKIARQQHDIEKFRCETDRLTFLLCQSLNFKSLNNSATQGQFYGRMIDASNPAFSLNIRPKFPVIYACDTEINEDVAMGVMGLLYRFAINANFFALLIVFSNLQELRKQVRESAFKNDFIVLTYNHLWDILAARSPIQQLSNCILEQVDLVFLSPYTVGGPVPEKMFFGRTEEEKILLQNIKGKNYALLANRKSGKTSLLNKIYPVFQAIPDYQVFYCDLQAVNDYETFYLELFLFYPELEKISQIHGSSPSTFKNLYLDIKQRYSDKIIIFIFDEVDHILAYDLQNKEQLFKVFRSLSQRESIRFIFSGTTTLVKRTGHPDSPLFNFCNPLKLGLLEEKAARELVTVPMRTLGVQFENESAIVQRILSITARHPNAIQYICTALIQRINKKLERTIEEQDLDSVLAPAEFYDYFESLIWGQSTALEKLIVYAMWSYPGFTESEVIEEFKQRAIPSDGVKASLEILLTYSTLSKKNEKYFFTFREFAKLMEKRSDIPALTEQYKREIGGSEA